MELLDILHKIGYGDVKDLGKEYRVRPLYRPSDNNTSLCIKKPSGDWYDFSERVGGSLIQLIQKTLGLPNEESVLAFMGDTKIPQNLKNRYELTDIKKFDKGLLLKLQKEHQYWLDRGISLKTIINFDGGITRNGRMAHRYVFPIFNEKDDLVGFTGRLLKDNDKYPKWKHLGAKSQWCYPFKWNQEFLSEAKEVILVESIGDMLALWDNGIKNVLVTFGVDIGPKIIELLLKIDVSKIIIAFNNDEDNNLVGNRAAHESKMELMNFFDPHQIILGIPEYKDFGIMTPEQINQWKISLNQNN